MLVVEPRLNAEFLKNFVFNVKDFPVFLFKKTTAETLERTVGSFKRLSPVVDAINFFRGKTAKLVILYNCQHRGKYGQFTIDLFMIMHEVYSQYRTGNNHRLCDCKTNNSSEVNFEV